MVFRGSASDSDSSQTPDLNAFPSFLQNEKFLSKIWIKLNWRATHHLNIYYVAIKTKLTKHTLFMIRNQNTKCILKICTSEGNIIYFLQPVLAPHIYRYNYFCIEGQSSSKFFPQQLHSWNLLQLTVTNLIISSVTEIPLLETEVNIIGAPIKQLERKKIHYESST